MLAQGVSIHTTDTLICLIKDDQIVSHVSSTFWLPQTCRSSATPLVLGIILAMHRNLTQDLHSIQWQELFTSVAAMTWQLRDITHVLIHVQTVVVAEQQQLHLMSGLITKIPHSIHKHSFYNNAKCRPPQWSRRH